MTFIKQDEEEDAVDLDELTLVNRIDTSVEGWIDIDPLEGRDSIDITTSATASLADDEDADGDDDNDLVNSEGADVDAEAGGKFVMPGKPAPLDEDDVHTPIVPIEQTVPDDDSVDVWSVQGRVIRLSSVHADKYDEDTVLTIDLADGTAATSVRVTGREADNALDEVDRGDHIVISGVIDRESRSNIGLKGSSTCEVHVVDACDADADPSEYISVHSRIDHLGGVWNKSDSNSESKTKFYNEVADILREEYTIAVPYGDERSVEWWMYVDSGEDEGIYNTEAESRLDEILEEKLPPEVNGSTERRKIIKEVVSKSRVEPGTFRGGVPDDEDLQWMVGVQNGVIDLRTGELHDHSPKWQLTSKIPVEYHPDEYDGFEDGIDWFLSDVCKSDEDRVMAVSMLAHSLMRNHQIKAMFPILGPGDSGKSKWHGVIRRILGEDNVHSVNISNLAGEDGFESGRIKDVHAILDDDASGKKIKNLSYLKKITGGETVTVNRKNKPLIDYKSYATTTWLSNNPAVLGTRDTGVQTRMYPIVMPHRHTEHDDEHKDKIAASELENRIYAEDELQAALVAAVEKAGEMYEAGGVPAERDEDERWALYDRWADDVKRFFDECVVEDPDHVTLKSAVYRSYVNWCEDSGLEPMGESRFWTVADQSGPYMEHKRVWFDSDVRGAKHVRLGPEGLRYAPDAVLSDLDNASQTIDSPTPIREISPYRGPSFYSVEATLREGDPYEPGWIAEGDDASIRVQMDPQGERGIDTVAEEFKGVPNVDDGDRVLLQRFERVTDENRPVLKFVAGYSGVKILSKHPGDDAQSRISGSDVTEELLTQREALLQSTSQENVEPGGLDPVAAVKAVLGAAREAGTWSHGPIVENTPDDIGAAKVFETMQVVESDDGAVMESFLPGGMTREDAVELVNSESEDEDEDDGNDEDDDPDDEQGDDGDEREGGQDDEDGGENGSGESDASDLNVSEEDFDGVDIDGSGSESKQVVRSDDVKPADVKTAVESVNGSDAAPIDDIVAAVGADRVSVVSVVETMLDSGLLHEPAEDQYRVVRR